jgi:hypothetical protein
MGSKVNILESTLKFSACRKGRFKREKWQLFEYKCHFSLFLFNAL